MEDNTGTKRVLEWFEKEGNTRGCKEEIKTLTLDDLRAIFGINDVHPDENTEVPYKEGHDPYMVGYDYAVTEKHAKALQPHFKHKIDFTKYDYFVAAYARDS